MNKSYKYDSIICLSFFIIYLFTFIGVTFLMKFIDSSVSNKFWRIFLIVVLSTINLGNIGVGIFMLSMSIRAFYKKKEINISITGEGDYGVSSETNSDSD